jgi:2-methylisocitrate lyase-like PEP mutase family enzyme
MNDHDKRLRFREILGGTSGVIAPGAAEPLFAKLVQDCGYPAVHASGNAIHKQLVLPDSGLITMTEVAQLTASISVAVDIPLIVDGETGYGGPDQTARSLQLFERAGAAAVRFEDSVFAKSGHGVAGKEGVTPISEMTDKIKAAVDARNDDCLTIILRCDTRACESLPQIQERLVAYVEAGADAVGVHLSDVNELKQVAAQSPAPLVSLWPRTLMPVFEFLKMGYRVALLPSSAPLAAAAAVRAMLLELKEKGTERSYFSQLRDFKWVSSWYANLGKRSKEHR